MTRPRQFRTRLKLDALEDRTLLSVCHVTRLTDAGVGKGFRGDLRYCINKVNSQPGTDGIDFTVTGTINLNSALPVITENLNVNGPGSGQLSIARNAGLDYRLFQIPAGVEVELEGLTLRSGQETMGGGIHNAGTLTLSDVILTQNVSTTGLGGGIYNTGTLAINTSTISDNQAVTNADTSYGGGIYNAAGGVVTIHASVVSGNETTGNSTMWDGYGGGIFSQGYLTVTDSTITQNRTEAKPLATGPSVVHASGGGIYNLGNMILESSTVFANSVFADGAGSNGVTVASGAGVASEGEGISSINNSTVAQNFGEAKSYALGGGVWNNAGTLTITRSTIAFNYLMGTDAVQGGGLISGGVVDVRNSIIAKNALYGGTVWGAYGPDLDCGLSSSGYNLIGDSSGSETTRFEPTDIIDTDALLGTLGDHGGPTYTYDLLPNSPAINTGDNTDAPQWDQRGDGYNRVVNNTIDMGAFEVQSSPIPSPNISWAVLMTAEKD